MTAASRAGRGLVDARPAQPGGRVEDVSRRRASSGPEESIRGRCRPGHFPRRCPSGAWPASSRGQTRCKPLTHVTTSIRAGRGLVDARPAQPGGRVEDVSRRRASSGPEESIRGRCRPGHFPRRCPSGAWRRSREVRHGVKPLTHVTTSIPPGALPRVRCARGGPRRAA